MKAMHRLILATLFAFGPVQAGTTVSIVADDFHINE